MKHYLGVDLGLVGAITMIDENGKMVFCESIPTLKVLVGKKMRNQYNISHINEMFKFWVEEYNIVKAGMERLRPIPHQASQVAFSMGGSTMLFKTLFTVHQIPFIEMESRMWQKEIFSSLGVQYNKFTTKDASILAAKQLFPGFNFKRTERCKVDCDGMTDSACIAEYIKRISK